MHKETSSPSVAVRVLAALLLAGSLAATAGAAEAPADAAAARKARIVANLQVSFAQLRELGVVVAELKPSGIPGLDEGTLMVNNQPQSFLVTSDDKRFYLVGPPIDVSRSAEEIEAEVARIDAAQAKAAEERETRLAARIAELPFRGEANAPVTIVEFSDFQCPFCSRGYATVEQIMAKYPGKVKFVFMHFPLDFHNWAKPAAIAAHCAAEQSPDAFWALHDGYFQNQAQLNPGNLAAKSQEYLAGAKIDLAKWSTCSQEQASPEYLAAAAAIAADMSLGQSMGVSGTPGFFVNGQFINGAQPLTAFEPIIDAILAEGNDAG